MMTIDWKDVGIRALKTFIQAACGSIVTLLANGGDSVVTDAAVISVVAAGVSAVWNGVVNPLLNSLMKHGSNT